VTRWQRFTGMSAPPSGTTHMPKETYLYEKRPIYMKSIGFVLTAFKAHLIENMARL